MYTILAYFTAQQAARSLMQVLPPPQIASERLLLWGSFLYTHICSSFLTEIKFVVVTTVIVQFV